METEDRLPLAYRKSYSRSGSFRRRGATFKRRGTRVITEPKRWELANFHFVGSITPNPDVSEGVVLDLISQSHFDDYGLDAQVRGVTDAMRSVDVGGLVWTTMFYNPGSGGATGAYGAVQELLYTDRIDPAGLPVAGLTTDWWDTQAPIAPAGTQDAEYPVRLHQRHARVLYLPGTNDFAGGVASSTLLANAAMGSNAWPTRNQRIRGGLGDRQGLFLQLTLLNPNGNENQAFTAFRVVGSLYYRVRM